MCTCSSVVTGGLSLLYLSMRISWLLEECVLLCAVHCIVCAVNRKHLITSFRTDFRSSYIMNSTIAGIEASDTNPT